MLRALVYATIVSLLWIGSSSNASAGIINLTANGFWNTGVNDSNQKLSTNPSDGASSLDSHWTGRRVSGTGDWADGNTIKTGGLNGTTNGYAVGDAFNVAPILPIAAWVTDASSAVSRWVTPEKIRPSNGQATNGQNGSNGEAHNASVWEYSLNVFNPVAAPNQLLITGQWSSDNDVYLFVNGVDSGISRKRGLNSGGTATITTFASWENFSIPSHLLVAGSNVLTFQVQNGVSDLGGSFSDDTSPSKTSAHGLRVEFLSGSEQVVPEPSSMLVCGGLALCGMVARRRKRKTNVV